MNFKDFISNFSGVNICWVRDFEEARLKGMFVREMVGDNSRVVPKRYYTVKPKLNTKVYFAVHQHDERTWG
jgi:hypothetical protein